jgi:hypothetical protein
VRTQYLSGTTLKLEHFWLCEVCAPAYNFRIFSDRPAIAIDSEPRGQRYVTAEQAGAMTRQTAGHAPPVSSRPRGPESGRFFARPELSGSLPGHLPSQQTATERFGAPLSNRT